MKNVLTTALLIFPTIFIFAQNAMSENKMTIVSCKTGDLYIDGNLIGKIEADDARQQSLTIGEHYLQVKTGSEKYNRSATIDLNTRSVIRIGCEPVAIQSATVEAAKPVLLIDKQLNLGGLLTGEVQRNAIALDEDDIMLLNCIVTNPRGSAKVSVRQYPSGNEIFRNESFNAVRDQKITIPSRGIYVIEVSTGAVFGKDIRLTIARISSSKSDPNFKTSVKRYFDTTQVEIVNDNVTVHSVNAMSGTNRNIVKIPLPPQTTYWVYWVGVGQESREQMAQLSNQLGRIASKFSTNPLVAFGLNQISSLPMLKNKSTITYRFMDDQNASLFLNKQPCSYLNVAYADNVSASYSLVNDVPKNVVLTLNNSNTFLAQDVVVKVVAFKVRTLLAIDN